MKKKFAVVKIIKVKNNFFKLLFISFIVKIVNVIKFKLKKAFTSAKPAFNKNLNVINLLFTALNN